MTHAKYKIGNERKDDLDKVNKLIDEMVDKIRIWSGKHAELLQDLLLKKDQIRSADIKQLKREAHIVKDKLSRALINSTTKLE